MSMMRCDGCGHVVDTDDDPDSLYETDTGCYCERCREDRQNGEYEYTDAQQRSAYRQRAL